MCSQPLSLGRIPKLCQLKLLCQRAKLNEKQMISEDQNVHHKYWQVGYCRNLLMFSIRYRRCSGCRKRRSLRSNSFFEEFPKVALGKLLLTIYFFTTDHSQRRIARHLGLNPGLVSKICRRLQDVCSMDL